MNMITQYDKDKILLQYIKKLPQEILPRILFNDSGNPNDAYILDEDEFQVFKTKDQETPDFYNSLANSYISKNIVLYEELKELLTVIQTIINENNITCLDVQPTIYDEDEILLKSGELFRLLDIRTIKSLAKNKNFDMITDFYNSTYHHHTIDSFLHELGISKYKDDETFMLFIKLAAAKGRDRYKRLIGEIEVTRSHADKIEQLNLDNCKIIRMK